MKPFTLWISPIRTHYLRANPVLMALYLEGHSHNHPWIGLKHDHWPDDFVMHHRVHGEYSWSRSYNIT